MSMSFVATGALAGESGIDIVVNAMYYRTVVNSVYYRSPPMTTASTEVRADPSDETIQLGPLAVRFLVTGHDSNDSVAAFELVVPAAERLAAPAHSHDHYEETIYGLAGVLTWTVDGRAI